MAHTPGPWWVDPHHNIMAEGGLVAFPGISAGFDQTANAKLIATTPELLTELVYARAVLEHCVDCLHDIDDVRETRHAITSITQVINKAIR